VHFVNISVTSAFGLQIRKNIEMRWGEFEALTDDVIRGVTHLSGRRVP